MPRDRMAGKWLCMARDCMRCMLKVISGLAVMVLTSPVVFAENSSDQPPHQSMLHVSKAAVPSDHLKSSLMSEPMVGEGRYRYYFWNVYDAKLFAEQGKWSAHKPFVLQLTYLRDLKGKDIAKQSIKEMRQQGFTDEIQLATWFAQLSEIFPDVEQGQSLIGLFRPGQGAEFWMGQRSLGSMSDPQFSQRFFDIWLGEKTSAPELRRQLLGMSD